MGSKKKKPMARIASEEVVDTGSISSFEKVSLADSPEASDRDSPVPSDHETAPAAAPPTDAAGEEIEEMAPEDAATQPEAACTTAAPPPAPKTDPMVRELEEAAAVAAAATAEAAAAAKQKLMAGANSAKAFMSSLWSAFDDQGASRAAEAASEAALRERLGLADDEPIFEAFRCKLIQQYAPANNTFTPPKNIAFSGVLHVAARHVCFELDGGGGAAAPVVIPAGELAGVSREGDALRVALTGDREVVVGAFSLPKLEVESALALLQGLCDGNGQGAVAAAGGAGTSKAS
jgi:hypothetical protein